MARDARTGDQPPESPFPKECPNGLPEMCEDLKLWGTEWQTWGEAARQEIRFLRTAICALERKLYYNVPPGAGAGRVCDANGPIPKNGGAPPQDPTGPPPKPPFK